MFFNKFIIVFLLFFFTIFSFGMDFSDDGGMNFGGDEVKSTKKVHKKKHKRKTRKSRKSRRTKKNKKKKKKVVKKTETEDSGMTFGEETKTETKKDSGMTFVEETKTEKKEDSGMTFGEDDASGMVFGEEETGSDGKIKQEEMNFDLKEVEKTIDPKKSKKDDKVKIVTKAKSYVEKGIYFKLSSGTTFLLAPKLSNGIESNEKSLLGFTTNLAFGYDMSTALSLEAYTQFIFNQAQIKGENNILYSRDFNSRTFGLGLNFNLLNNERTNIHINLHGGLLMIDPSLEIDGIKVSAGALVGFEYYLLLRHFSVLTFASSDYMTGYDTVSISVEASLKYSF